KQRLDDVQGQQAQADQDRPAPGARDDGSHDHEQRTEPDTRVAELTMGREIVRAAQLHDRRSGEEYLDDNGDDEQPRGSRVQALEHGFVPPSPPLAAYRDGCEPAALSRHVMSCLPSVRGPRGPWSW